MRSGVARAFGLAELTHRVAQELHLTVEIAAAPADREVNAQRDPIAEGEYEIFFSE